MLESNVNLYNTLKNKADEIKAQMDALRLEIIAEMESKNLKTVDTEEVNLTLKYADYITYDDKAIPILKDIAPACIKEVIDLPTVKASIKAGLIKDELAEYMKVDTRKSITLKAK
jgi:tRNA U34 5-carboxymethylaminomethyl modifying enzyme MnmG/GidA